MFCSIFGIIEPYLGGDGGGGGVYGGGRSSLSKWRGFGVVCKSRAKLLSGDSGGPIFAVGPWNIAYGLLKKLCEVVIIVFLNQLWMVKSCNEKIIKKFG